MLTAIILTLNESAHIQACIESLRFADRVLVFDSFSTDATCALAQESGAVVMQRRFDHYANQRNAALEAAREMGADWALFVDADERITPDSAREIQDAISHTDAAGFRLPRHNFIFGKLTRGAGWYPDYQTRLLRVGAAHYDPERQVHEVVVLEGVLETLTQPIVHHNYRDLPQFLEKQRRYTAYEAQILYQQGVKPKARNFILQPLRHFRWRYVTLKGWRDGWHGLRLSVLMAWYELRKYQLLRGLWRAGKSEHMT